MLWMEKTFPVLKMGTIWKKRSFFFDIENRRIFMRRFLHEKIRMEWAIRLLLSMTKIFLFLFRMVRIYVREREALLLDTHTN